MPSVSETLARLAQVRTLAPAGGADRLSDLTAFGTDPGNLRARYYVPAGLAAGAALVVVLHGCTQNAAGYDQGSGWSTLADRQGFALLYPEQRPANNANRCFNWFQPGDIARDHGEAHSIRQMVAHMVATHAIDPARVFVTGLSAGGAMTAVMLATYPEVFAGGAIIAGLPYGVASSVGEALQQMRGANPPGPAALVSRVRAAAPDAERWPTLSVWHGTADQTVAPANAEAIITQWSGLHEIASGPRHDTVDGQARRRWTDSSGRVVIEAISIARLAHGTPIDPAGPEGCGTAMPFMLPAGICSTSHIAAFWGIAKTVAVPASAPARPSVAATAKPARVLKPAPVPVIGGVAKVIEDALRAAGLMR